MSYVSPTMRGNASLARQGLSDYSQSLRGSGFTPEEEQEFNAVGEEWTGDQYNAGIDKIRRNHESYLERQNRLAAPATSQSQAQAQPQAQTTMAPAANPWQEWGLDPVKPVPQGQSGSKDQAIAGLRYAGQTIHGRQLTEEEINQAAAAAGYTGDGPVSGEQYNKALSFIQGLKGGNQVGVQTSSQTSAGSKWGVRAPAAYKPSSPAPNALPAHMQVNRPEFAQYNAPNTAQTDGQMDALLEELLNNPGSLGPDVVNQIKARAKEQAVSQSEQLRGNARTDLLSRGFDGGGGTALAADAAVDSSLLDSLINSNREIDIDAATTNRADLLNALGIADSVLTGRTGRAGENFRNTLAGQTTQADSDFRRDQLSEDTRRFDSDYGLKRWGAEEGFNLEGANSALRNAEFEYGQQRDDRQMTLNELLGKEGIGLDKARLDAQIDQFKAAGQMDMARLLEQMREFDIGFGEDQRQFNNTLARGYSQDNQKAQSDYLNYFLSMFA